MPAETTRQANAAKLAIAVKSGVFPKSKAGPSIKQMAKSMTRKKLKHFTKVKECMNEDQKKKFLGILKTLREEYTGNIGGEIGTGLNADGPPINEDEYTVREKPEANVVAQTYDTEADFDSYVRVRRGIEITPKEAEAIANFTTIRPMRQDKFSVEYRTTDDFGNNDTTIIKKLLQDKQFSWVAFSKHETAEEEGQPNKKDNDKKKENPDNDDSSELPPLNEFAPVPSQSPQQGSSVASSPQHAKHIPQPPPPKPETEDDDNSFEVKDAIRVTKSITFHTDEEGADTLSDFLQKLEI